jgi:hypothetical protein
MGIQVQGLLVLGVFILIIALIHYGSYWMVEKRFRKLRKDKPNEFIEWVIPKERMEEYQKTDVLHIGGFPFITMTESKMVNSWYHDKLDYVCYLSMDGFHITKNSYLNKSSLEERGLLREKKSNPTGDDIPVTIFEDKDTGHKVWFTDKALEEMNAAGKVIDKIDSKAWFEDYDAPTGPGIVQQMEEHEPKFMTRLEAKERFNMSRTQYDFAKKWFDTNNG